MKDYVNMLRDDVRRPSLLLRALDFFLVASD
jgi:hypothetical protein